MDAKTAADQLRKIADKLEKVESLQAVAIVLPPEPGTPIEIILAGSPPAGSFAQYVMGQIQAAAAPANQIGYPR